jgi:hypothetical protein
VYGLIGLASLSPALSTTGVVSGFLVLQETKTKVRRRYFIFIPYL